MPRVLAILINNLKPGAKVSGTVHSCEHCAAMFIGSKDARFCCDACRKAASRRETK